MIIARPQIGRARVNPGHVRVGPTGPGPALGQCNYYYEWETYIQVNWHWPISLVKVVLNAGRDRGFQLLQQFY